MGARETVFLSGMCWLISRFFEGLKWLRNWVWRIVGGESGYGVALDWALFFLLNIYISLVIFLLGPTPPDLIIMRMTKPLTSS